MGVIKPVGREWEQRFYGMEDFLDYVTSPCDATRRASQDEGYGSWSGVSWHESIKMGREGWQAGVAIINSVAMHLTEIVADKMILEEIVYDVTGDMLDVGIFLTGEPECFMSFEPTDEVIQQHGKVVHIVANGTVSASVSQEVINLRGATIAALAQVLELAGRSVIVDVVFGIGEYPHEGADQIRTYIRAKEAGEALSITKMAFLLAHPSMLRRLEFSAMEHLPAEARRKWGVGHGNYGYPGDVPKKEQGDIYMAKALSRSGWTMEDAKKFLLETLESQNIKVEWKDRERKLV